MTAPTLATIPQKLPKTQAEWDALTAQLRAWQQVLGPLLQLLDTPSTSATAGTASPLPATPAGYTTTTIGGVTYKVALYKP